MDYDGKIKELEKEYNNKRKELVAIQEKIMKTVDEMHKESDEYVKIECPKCSGEGFYRDKDKSLKQCDQCINHRGWLWVKLYKPKDD